MKRRHKEDVYSTNDELRYLEHIGEHCEYVNSKAKLLRGYLNGIEKWREVWKGPGLNINREVIIKAVKERLRAT